MLRINYYISGHGYGHATRSAQLMSALLCSSDTTLITIITSAPAHLFPASPRVSLIPFEVDAAIIQPQPYSIDAAASFANLDAFLSNPETTKWQERAAIILDETQCNLILADAPYPATWAEHARKRGVRSILISNFTFDAIFEQLLTLFPSGAREEHLVDILKRLYATYDFVVRLPGFIHFPFVDKLWNAEEKAHRMIDAPLVFRLPRSSRETVLEQLKIPVENYRAKILLVQFGGQRLIEMSLSHIPLLPTGWICLCSSPVKDPRFFTFPSDIYSPDLVAAADAVLGKIGYGTVSECVAFNKPLIYVIRPMFAEEPGLLKYLNHNGVCEEILVTDYESGNWAEKIVAVSRAREGNKRKAVLEGSNEVAKIIEKLSATGL